MAEPLCAKNNGNGSFEVKIAQNPAGCWTAEQLRAYIVAHGYSANDADAIVMQAVAALEIQMLITQDGTPIRQSVGRP